MWKPLHSRRVLKSLRGSPKGKAQRGQYLLAVGLGCYKWYQSHTPRGVPVRRLSPKGEVDNRQYASKDTESRDGVDCAIPHRLERGAEHSLLGCGNLSLASPKKTISTSGGLGLGRLLSHYTHDQNMALAPFQELRTTEPKFSVILNRENDIAYEHVISTK